MVDSIVTEFRDVRRLLDQLVRRRRVCFLACSVVVRVKQAAPDSTGRAAAFTENVSLADRLLMSTVGLLY